MHFEEFQNVLTVPRSLLPGECLFVVVQSQPYAFKESSRNVACFLPSFQLFEKPERFIAMSGMGVGSNEHCENGWPTLRKRQCLLQHWNFFG